MIITAVRGQRRKAHAKADAFGLLVDLVDAQLEREPPLKVAARSVPGGSPIPPWPVAVRPRFVRVQLALRKAAGASASAATRFPRPRFEDIDAAQERWVLEQPGVCAGRYRGWGSAALPPQG